MDRQVNQTLIRLLIANVVLIDVIATVWNYRLHLPDWTIVGLCVLASIFILPLLLISAVIKLLFIVFTTPWKLAFIAAGLCAFQTILMYVLIGMNTGNHFGGDFFLAVYMMLLWGIITLTMAALMILRYVVPKITFPDKALTTRLRHPIRHYKNRHVVNWDESE